MKVAIFINNSSGELDWIVPFIKNTKLNISFDIYLYHKRLWDYKIPFEDNRVSVMNARGLHLFVLIDTFLDDSYRYLCRKTSLELNIFLKLFFA